MVRINCIEGCDTIMFKGKRIYGALESSDKYGDSIYDLKRKWKKIAKKNMHKTLRRRFKEKTRDVS